MSVQETNLKAIADAIREKDGSSNPIPASDFPERIRAISSIPKDAYTINVESNDSSGGSATGGGFLSSGMSAEVTVTAKVNSGYGFDGWSENGLVLSKDLKYSFKPTKSINLTANFSIPKYMAGVYWYEITLPASLQWADITYGNGKFVAIAYNTTEFIYSSDGINWITGTLPKNCFSKIIYADNKFVVMSTSNGESFQGYIAYSSDLINWTMGTRISLKDKYANCNDIVYGNNKFVVVKFGDSDGAYGDLINSWKTTYTSDQYLDRVAYNGTYFVSTVNLYGRVVYSKSDRLKYTWTSSSIPVSDVSRIIAVYGTFILAQTTGREVVYGTVDNWKSSSLPYSPNQGGTWTGMAYGEGKVVLVSSYGLKAAYSEDNGKTWNASTLPSSERWNSVAYGDGKFIAVAAGTNKAAYSGNKAPGT